MKTEQDDRLRQRRDSTRVYKLEAGGVLSQPTQRCLERLQPPEIVGEVADPVLEAVRRRFWRALDRFWYRIVLIRLSIFDRILGPDPSGPQPPI